jgi:hypothetical protein
MGLIGVLVDGAAHRLAVDCQTLVLCRIDFVSSLQGAVQMGRIDTDEDVTDDRFAWHGKAPIS